MDIAGHAAELASLQSGHPGRARVELTAALGVGRRTGDRQQQATSHSALARS
ncbi:MAG TPA: hypothetical protein VGJ19_07280 [Streptosporangiaceae bacterium]